MPSSGSGVETLLPEKQGLGASVLATVAVLYALAKKSAAVVGMAALLSLTGCTLAEPSGRGAAPPPQAQAAVSRGPSPMDTFRALAPSEGLKFTPLFAGPAGDNAARFHRLETAVQELRNDFDTVTPTLVRLAAIEKDIRDLVSQLQDLTGEASRGASVPGVRAPVGEVAAAPIAPKPQAPKPAPARPATEKASAGTPPPGTAKTAAPVEQKIPRGDIAGGTETAPAKAAAAVTTAPSSRVTPEAAPTGKMPPEGAASPFSPPAPAAKPTPDAKPEAPLSLITPPPPSAAVQAQEDVPPPQVAKGPVVGDIRDIRIGDHIDRTRIVLDLAAEGRIQSRLAQDGRQLVIDLPQHRWPLAPKWEATTANLVSGYRYADGVLVLDLMTPAVVKKQGISSSEGQLRFVIDLFAPLIHVE